MNGLDVKNRITTVGYQGVAGAYAHIATQEYFKNRNTIEKNYFSFEDVVIALDDEEIEYGVLPIENSSCTAPL